MIHNKAIISLAALIFLFVGITSSQVKHQSFKPGEIWPDNNGVHINAHGGGILKYEGTYFWFGEHKTEGEAGNRANVGVHCYSSKDLYNWKDEGIALAVSQDPESEIVKGCVIERPKVIFNQKTKKFVMWFHLELKSMGYKAARTGLAVADSPAGPFRYIKSLNPNAGQWPANFTEEQKVMQFPANLKSWSFEWKMAVADGLYVHRDFAKGQMARDMALFVDEDGKAYHIHSSEENLTLHISELNDDYTDFTKSYATVMPAGHNEAPAIFKKEGKYFLITSGCTGWTPNAARSFVADHILGPWTELGNPCRGTEEEMKTTFESQSTFILENPNKPGQYIFMADRWRPNNAIDGRYIWLPIFFEDGKPVLKWMDKWDLSFFNK
jgi:beta-xylosidase